MTSQPRDLAVPPHIHQALRTLRDEGKLLVYAIGPDMWGYASPTGGGFDPVSGAIAHRLIANGLVDEAEHSSKMRRYRISTAGQAAAQAEPSERGSDPQAYLWGGKIDDETVVLAKLDVNMLDDLLEIASLAYSQEAADAGMTSASMTLRAFTAPSVTLPVTIMEVDHEGLMWFPAAALDTSDRLADAKIVLEVEPEEEALHMYLQAPDGCRVRLGGWEDDFLEWLEDNTDLTQSTRASRLIADFEIRL